MGERSQLCCMANALCCQIFAVVMGIIFLVFLIAGSVLIDKYKVYMDYDGFLDEQE